MKRGWGWRARGEALSLPFVQIQWLHCGFRGSLCDANTGIVVLFRGPEIHTFSPLCDFPRWARSIERKRASLVPLVGMKDRWRERKGKKRGIERGIERERETERNRDRERIRTNAKEHGTA